jgi:hypothetical protein
MGDRSEPLVWIPACAGMTGGREFAGSDLERFGFETTPNIAIDASAAITTPGLSTRAIMALGFVGAFFAARRRSLRLA